MGSPTIERYADLEETYADPKIGNLQRVGSLSPTPQPLTPVYRKGGVSVWGRLMAKAIDIISSCKRYLVTRFFDRDRGSHYFSTVDEGELDLQFGNVKWGAHPRAPRHPRFIAWLKKGRQGADAGCGEGRLRGPQRGGT
jgi:hypothetical protein